MTELGSRLKEARLEKGMSLDDLQTATKIQKRYLMGIEEGNYSMMPGPFYVRAFIKQYAEAVGLKPDEILEEYKGEIPATVNEDIPEKLSRVQSRKTVSSGGSRFLEILPMILIIAFVVGAMAVLYFFWATKDTGDSVGSETEGLETNEQVNVEESDSFTDKKNKDKEKPVEEEDTHNGDAEEEVDKEEPESTATQEITVVETAGKKSVYELKHADRFELKIVSTGETWVSVKNGKGYSFFSSTLVKGKNESESFDLTKETEAEIIIGRSTETEIYLNDEKLEFANPPSQFVRQDITIHYLPNQE